jgi:hypothetical protein
MLSKVNYLDLQSNETDPTVLAAMKRSDYISPLDDLAFAMYQDPEISSIIRDLDKKKTDCALSNFGGRKKKAATDFLVPEILFHCK